MERILDKASCEGEIKKLVNNGLNPSYNSISNSIIFSDTLGNKVHSVILPIDINYDVDTHEISEHPIGYIVVLIEASHAAICYAEDDLILNHKVFSSYMVRQKQGKSQVKYLKTKGKSKAGSRVRLASTNRFFEDINQYLIDIHDQYEVKKIVFSCSKTLLPFLFNSKPHTPFKKDDPRIFKLPMSLNRLNTKTLETVIDWLLQTKTYSYRDFTD